jgi:ABC-type nitrate/sulfonate/bicarbonate transport system substrate-binding protein
MNDRNARWAGLVAATIALSWLLPGVSLAQDKPLTPVRAAYVPVATWLPAWVALDRGILAKHGLAVT